MSDAVYNVILCEGFDSQGTFILLPLKYSPLQIDALPLLNGPPCIFRMSFFH